MIVDIPDDIWHEHIAISRVDGLWEFVCEYTVDFDYSRAREVTGSGRWDLANDIVQLEIERRLNEVEADSKLRAEYIREFIYQILEFKPIDHFLPCPGGGWLMTQDAYMKLPETAKKLIEDVEWRVLRGEHYLAVRFVSKTKALEMACRYTLTQSVQIAPTLAWDKIAAAVPKDEDPVALALAEAERAAGIPA